MNIKRIIQTVGLVGLLAGCNADPKAVNAPKRDDYKNDRVVIRLNPGHREYSFSIRDTTGDAIVDQIISESGLAALGENDPRRGEFPETVTLTPRARALASEMLGLHNELSYELEKARYEAKKGE